MNLENLKMHIIEKYNAHTIILYGSFSRGDSDEDSDIDLVAFRDEAEEIQDKSMFCERLLDLWIFPTSKLSDIPDFVQVNGGKILHDENELADSFMRNISHYLSEERQMKSDEEIQNLIKWLEKMHRRAGKQDLEGMYRKNWLLTEILPIYFEINGLFYLGSKDSFRHLRENDSVGFEVYKTMYENPDSKNIEAVIDFLKKLKVQNR